MPESKGPPERLRELVGEVCDELEGALEIIHRIVFAKREGHPDPEAWAAAFELVDRLAGEAGAGPAPTTARCPDCKAIVIWPVVSLDGSPSQAGPTRIDCGPVHILHFVGYRVLYEAGESHVSIDEPATVVGSSVSVFGADAEGGKDGDVQG